MKPVLITTVRRDGVEWHTYLRQAPRQTSPTGLALIFAAAPPANVAPLVWPIEVETIEAVLGETAGRARARLEGELVRALSASPAHCDG